MTDKVKEKDLRKLIKIGDDAEKCFKFFENAANDVKSKLNEAIIKSDYSDKDIREESYRMIRAVDSIMGQIMSHVKEGNKAKTKLEKLLEQAKKIVNLRG